MNSRQQFNKTTGQPPARIKVNPVAPLRLEQTQQQARVRYNSRFEFNDKRVDQKKKNQQKVEFDDLPNYFSNLT